MRDQDDVVSVNLVEARAFDVASVRWLLENHLSRNLTEAVIG